MIDCEAVAGHPEFRHLSTVQGIAYDLRYASPHNFSGRVLYGALDCAWLRVQAAQGLERAADWLDRHHPGYRLLVLDALRPQRVQEAIWEDVRGTPQAAYFADPALGSIHSYGLAVDLTVLDPSGRECDMGSGYDEMHERSHPSLETRHFARGELSADHLRHRARLYEAMAAGGFHGIATEWWHFDWGDRTWVRRELQRVR